MAFALNNLKRVDMPLNKETKTNQTWDHLKYEKIICICLEYLILSTNDYRRINATIREMQLNSENIDIIIINHL